MTTNHINSMKTQPANLMTEIKSLFPIFPGEALFVKGDLLILGEHRKQPSGTKCAISNPPDDVPVELCDVDFLAVEECLS